MKITKLTRGIDSSFASAFKECELYKLYLEHTDELFIGIRNNYLNLYYNCDSISKVTYHYGSLHCEIDQYYLNGISNNNTEKEKPCRKEPHEIYEKYEEIKKFSDNKKRQNNEKRAQAKLVLLNNSNNNSKWFCIDIEYVKPFRNKEERKVAKFSARFDIIAISKEKPHRVALIELKYGNKAIGGSSGITKHILDFSAFYEKNYFGAHLREEIIEIVRSQKELGISVPFDLPGKSDILNPEFYIITLNNNAVNEKGSTPQQTMAGYLFKDPSRWNGKRSSKLCIETAFGRDITRKGNHFYATFLFSKATLDNMYITDIINGDYDLK